MTSQDNSANGWIDGDRAERILVIKLGALGDFVQALGPAAAIRRHHPNARITLLTTRPFADLARASGYFDEIWIDERAPFWRVGGWWRLRWRIRARHFGRAYDLQTSDRTGFYFLMLGPGARPQWSGIAPGASHRHDDPRRISMHTLDRQADQLRLAGITDVSAPDLSFLAADLGRFALPSAYVLLVPGGAAHRPAKRWPVESYAALARWLLGRGCVPVILGGPDESALAAKLAAEAPGSLDLTGKTSFAEIAGLARGARAAVGNDTGPMHLIAAAGCPVLVLFSADSDPALCAPRGRRVAILRRPALAGLDLGEVAGELDRLLARHSMPTPDRPDS